MPWFIIALLIMLAAFLLLTLAAAVRWVWQLLRPPAPSTAASVAKPGEASTMTDGLLLVGVASAWHCVAMGWVCQFTIYPIYVDLAPFGPQVFHAFSLAYLSRLPIIVLPAGVMCLAWVLLLWFPGRDVSRRTVWAIVGLCVAFIAITTVAGSTQAEMGAHGFSESLYLRLMWSNAIRAVLFTAIGLLSLAALRIRMSHT
jgi:hypothetical protein